MNQAELLHCSRVKAGLLVIDIQERLAGAMDDDAMSAVEKNATILIEGAKALDLPVWATEQYPKGIGPTLEPLADAFPEGVSPVAKVDFSCAAVPEVLEALKSSGRTQIVVCGMESHICVFQTARDLVREGFQVFVPRDAVIARTQANCELGLQLMERAGAVITSTESVLFDMLGRAGSPEFKRISSLIK
ncbi:MAG: hydrolase [Deltaproteobacteria bacterium]|nr:MAG: hydrolase [Deltaproteobacteria bacterium]